MAHGPRKKPLDCGGNLDHVMLGLELRLCGGGASPYMHRRICVTWCLFKSYSFVTLAALAEVCTLKLRPYGAIEIRLLLLLFCFV